jgi:tetratricopeptide (TPR) repeat protein
MHAEDTLVSIGNPAVLYAQQGRYAEAELLFLQTLEIQRRVLGEGHPGRLGTITNLGHLYNSMERFEDAAAMFEVSVPIMRHLLGLQHPLTVPAMEALVAAYERLGRSKAAMPLQRELLGLRVAPADAADASAQVLNEAAWTLLTSQDESLHDPERALMFAQRACALAENEGREPDPNHLDTLALAQHRSGDTDAAIATQKRAFALMPEGTDPEMTARLAEYEAAVKER